MWTRLEFTPAAPPAPSLDRADVALIVGSVTRRRDLQGRPTPLPASLLRWWERGQGWWAHELRPGQPAHDREHLLNLPVPLEGWSDFEALFVPDRPVAGPAGLRVASAMAAAVRAFFAGGGRRCLVLRTGDALPYADPARPRFAGNPLLAEPALQPGPAETHDQRAAARVSLLPGLAATAAGVVSQATAMGGHWAEWQGLQWVHGLPEVSMLLLPDLPEAYAVPPRVPPAEQRPGAPLEVFAPCVPEADAPATTRLRLLAAPALDTAGFDAWRRSIGHALAMLRGPSATEQRRDVQLLAALPLPVDELSTTLSLQPQAAPGARVEDWLAPWLATPADGDDDDGADLRHSQLQLAWPWLRTQRSADLPQAVEAPDGAWAGALAAQCLRAGTFRSAALTPAAGVIDTLPPWTPQDALHTLWLPGEPAPQPVQDYLCLCLPRRSGSRGGFEWASDRTTAQDPMMRIGAVRRLLAQVMRHARRVGDDFVHEPSGEATWFRLRAALEVLGQRILRAGALDDSQGDAWVVTCDRRTMLQADLDAGRLIAQIQLRPALPIERISVTLTLRDGTAATLAEVA